MTDEMWKDVNKPEHYQIADNFEAIDVIDAVTANMVGKEAVYTANVIKYILRWKKKDGIKDLRKASKYLTWLIQYVHKKNFDDVIDALKAKYCMEVAEDIDPEVIGLSSFVSIIEKLGATEEELNMLRETL